MSSTTDFLAAINQIAAERNIDPNEVLEAIKSAVKTGFRRDYPEEEGVSLDVDIDAVVGSIRVYANKKVVDHVTNKATQISLADAKKLEPKLKIEDHVQVDITPSGDFGRVAAQAAKQVILQKIRESEKESIMHEFKDKIGEIDYGIVQRLDGENVIFEIRRAIAIMPKEDRIPIEFYKPGSRLKILIKAIAETPRGKQLIVSRADPEFLKGLFKLEVPEILSGSVEIKAIAREAGSRTKVAVSSNAEGVDPIGSCVGQKGVRINAIMNELRFGNFEEKIDIILWDDDTSTFISNALSPAQVISVTITKAEDKQAKVIVPDDQLSLAIGREGQNVRLAAKLTGWYIDIEGETIKMNDKGGKKGEKADEAATEEKPAKKSSKKPAKKSAAKKTTKKSAKKADGLPFSAKINKALADGGIKTMAEVKKMIADGTKVKGVGPKAIEEIKAGL